MAKNKKRPSSRKSIYLTDVEWAFIEKLGKRANVSINKTISSMIANQAFLIQLFQDDKAVFKLYQEYLNNIKRAEENFENELEYKRKKLDEMRFDEIMEAYPIFLLTDIYNYIKLRDFKYIEETTPQYVKDAINSTLDKMQKKDVTDDEYKKILRDFIFDNFNEKPDFARKGSQK